MNKREGMFHFNELDSNAQKVAIQSAIAHERSAVSRMCQNAKTAFAKNINGCINDKHYLSTIIVSLNLVKKMKNSESYAIRIIENNFMEFTIDGEYIPYTKKV